MTPSQLAEAKISELGIRDPQDIDIEAIAVDCGVVVEYAQLTGCEAMLVGVGSKAIATIRPSGSRGRERFSIGHELGHWEMHRGQSFRCRVDDPAFNLEANVSLEREADEFASHLLMPTPMFTRAIHDYQWPTISQIDDVARIFDSSRLATVIRMANVDSLPIIVTCYAAHKRLWYIRAPHVPRRWWLKGTLDPDTFASDLLARGKECSKPRKQSADAWFENDDAGEFEVLEQCISVSPGKVLAILFLCDPEMFERGYDPDVGWRR
jgi:hypothetical protein